MKKNKWICCFFAVLCLVMIICGFDKKDLAGVGKETISKKSDFYDIYMDIPKIEGLKNLDFQTQINDKIKRESSDFADQVQKEAEEYGKNLAGIKFIIKQDFSTTYNGKELLSIPVSRYYYAGGAHGVTTLKTLNIDKNSGKEIILKDLFKEKFDFKGVINKEISSQIEKNKNEYFPDEFKGIKDNTEFFLTNNGLVVYYQLYEIAPYVKGIPKFEIKYDLLKEGLKYNLT